MRTHDLFKQGQSPWLDMIERKMLQTGELKRMIEQGCPMSVLFVDHNRS